MSAPTKPADANDTRSERLAAALRENLKRRKAQAREQTRAREQAKEQTKSGERE